MLRVLKVTGDSLSPDFKEGDYVVIATLPFFLRSLHRGDVVVFEYGLYGTLIKRIERMDGDHIWVTGTRGDSLDSRCIGPVPRQAVQGKVIWHVPKPYSRVSWKG
ncbi:MAG: S26 family signal peptidase [Chloroflexota bacterium]